MERATCGLVGLQSLVRSMRAAVIGSSRMSLSNLVRRQRPDMERSQGRVFTDQEWSRVEETVLKGLVQRVDAVEEIAKPPIVVQLEAAHIALRVRFTIHEASEELA